MQTDLSKEDQKYLFDIILQKSAIVLDESKEYLIYNRLSPLLRDLKFNSLTELVRTLRMGSNKMLLPIVIDALTTNETLFFRDLKPFELLKNKIIPEVIEKNKNTKTINIWSAACSSGQEAYSIAMTIRENFPQLLNWNINILGTDISNEILTRASNGVYTQNEVNRGLPIKLLVKYFLNEQGKWVIKNDLRCMVNFRYLNFVDPWPNIPLMDIIFIRNVLIYFNANIKTNILTRMSKQLNHNGVLFLGASESTIGLEVPLKSSFVDSTQFFTTS